MKTDDLHQIRDLVIKQRNQFHKLTGGNWWFL